MMGKRRQEDRISGLPDEIIVEILSLLTLKEAITTSILSPRWTYLWTFISACLCFNDEKFLRDIVHDDLDFHNNKRSYETKFVNWVNHVLNVHQASSVDHFKVFYSLEARNSRVVDTWVDFAIKKRVQNLELNFASFRLDWAPSDPYALPNLEKLKLPIDHSLNHLKILRLKRVDVTEQVIHYFLKNCALLEELCLVHSHTISNLKIDGTESLKLKRLDLYRCEPLKNVEICAPNLVSFSYTGPKKEVPFRNVPSLTELCVGHEYCAFFFFRPLKHLSYLSRLVKLTLIFLNKDYHDYKPEETFPKLNNLKELELRVGVTRVHNLAWLTFLVRAAPMLSKFMIKLIVCIASASILQYQECCDTEYTSLVKLWHDSVQEIEIVGFFGFSTDYNLAVELIQSSTALRKITIDTRQSSYSIAKPNSEVDENIRKGRKRNAHKLRSYVPQSARLLII